MGAIAFAYKPNPAAAQYLSMPVSRWFECCLCRNDVLLSTLNMQTRTDIGRSVVAAESDNGGYSALMLTID